MLTLFKRFRDRFFRPKIPALMGEEYSVEWEGPNGEKILSFSHHDAWFYCVPGQGARRVYIGQDAEFNTEVLEIKYSCQHLFDVYINTFEEVRAVYIDPADPFVRLTLDG